MHQENKAQEPQRNWHHSNSATYVLGVSFVHILMYEFTYVHEMVGFPIHRT